MIVAVDAVSSNAAVSAVNSFAFGSLITTPTVIGRDLFGSLAVQVKIIKFSFFLIFLKIKLL